METNPNDKTLLSHSRPMLSFFATSHTIATNLLEALIAERIIQK